MFLIPIAAIGTVMGLYTIIRKCHDVVSVPHYHKEDI